MFACRNGFQNYAFGNIAATDQLNAISPTLLKGPGTLGVSATGTGSSTISTKFAGEGDDAVLVAVNNSSSNSRPGINFTLTGLDPSITTAEVLGEGRMITLDSNRHFIDNFDGRGVHVYRFIPEPVTALMLLLGIPLVLARRRKRR
jgi:hypothetical protein